MIQSITSFLGEVFRDYRKRFWRFWIILYGATVLLELVRQILLENLASLQYRGLSQELFASELLKEFLANPVLFVPVILIVLINMWGFASLFFSFQESRTKAAPLLGLKNTHRYAGFVLFASSITMLGFSLLTIPVFYFLHKIPVLLPLFQKSSGFFVTVPLLFVLAIPGIYLLVAFSNGPFILLFENKGIVGALRESFRRIKKRWWSAAWFLGASLVIAGIGYYGLSWIIFSLKLKFVPDMLLRGESMMRVFFYSIPWVIAASFYDLAVFHLYRRFQQNPVASTNAVQPRVEKSGIGAKGPFISPEIMKSIAVIVFIAFVATFVLFPMPAQAGGVFGWVAGTILGIVSCVVAGCVGFLVWFLVGLAVSTVTQLITTTITGTQALVLSPVTCSGDYDYEFGTCSHSRSEQQTIANGIGVKFNEFKFDPVPTPEDFRKNPSLNGTVNITWESNAPQGIYQAVWVVDPTTGTRQWPSENYSGNGVVCSSGPRTVTYALPYEKDFNAFIRYETCVRITGGKRTRRVTATCDFCGCLAGCGTMANSTLTTPKLPNPGADIKASGSTSNTGVGTAGIPSDARIAPNNVGRPVTLTWTSTYATSCEAEGNWSGTKPIEGSEIVVPTSVNDTYGLVCSRGDKKSPVDSVSFSSQSSGSIQLFNRGQGKLQILNFNATDPLNPGDTVTLSWDVEGATSCAVDNGIGTIPTSGNVQVTFVRSATFTLTCTDGLGRTTSKTHTIEVKKIPPFKEIKPE